MLVFIKRRWVLLSYAVLLMACSCFSVSGVRISSAGGMYHSLAGGLVHGRFYYSNGSWPGTIANESQVLQGFHRPVSGGIIPTIHIRANSFELSFPIWIPLAAVLGWIVISELRWRERRSKPLNTPLE